MDASQRVPAMLSFVHAADHGSFAAAARVLRISSAAVSKNIAGLEQSLGVRLMNRTTRSLQLTTEGLVFLERARVAINALDDAIDAVVAQRTEPVGKVRISTSNAFGSDYLLPIVPELQQRYPQLSLQIDFDDRKIDLVRDGYDLALRGSQVEDSSVVARHISTLSTVLVASPDYLQTHGIPKKIKDLDQHRLIAVRFLNGSMSRWGFRGPNQELIEIEPQAPALTLSAADAAVTAAVLGMGIAQTGVHHAWEHLQAGKLKVVLGKLHHPGKRAMTLQYPHRALMAPRVRATVDFILDKFAANPALHVTAEQLQEYQA